MSNTNQIAEELVLLEWIIRYVNNSSFFLENVTLESNSTIIDVIYGGTLKEVVIPIPPREEQASIISFLDYSVTEIDTKIAKNPTHHRTTKGIPNRVDFRGSDRQD